MCHGGPLSPNVAGAGRADRSGGGIYARLWTRGRLCMLCLLLVRTTANVNISLKRDHYYIIAWSKPLPGRGRAFSAPLKNHRRIFILYCRIMIFIYKNTPAITVIITAKTCFNLIIALWRTDCDLFQPHIICCERNAWSPQNHQLSREESSFVKGRIIIYKT